MKKLLSLLLALTTLAAALPAQAARQQVSFSPQRRDIFFADGATVAGNFYCEIPSGPVSGASILPTVTGYGGYVINFRPRPTLQLRQVAAGIAVQGALQTRTYNVPTIVGSDNIGQNGVPFPIPPSTQMRVGFSGRLYSEQGREPLYVLNDSGSLDTGAAVNCPVWQEDPEPIYIPELAIRVTRIGFNNITRFIRSVGRLPDAGELARILRR